MPKPKTPPKAPKAPPAPAPSKPEVEAADKVIRRMTGTDTGASKGKLANLPAVSALFASNEEMQTAITLLETGFRLKEDIEKASKGYENDGVPVPGLDTIKDDLTAIVLGAEVEGYRYGNMAVAVSLQEGRTTLNKDLLRVNLIDAGVDPTLIGEIIEKSHKRGEPFYTVKLEKINR